MCLQNLHFSDTTENDSNIRNKPTWNRVFFKLTIIALGTYVEKFRYKYKFPRNRYSIFLLKIDKHEIDRDVTQLYLHSNYFYPRFKSGLSVDRKWNKWIFFLTYHLQSLQWYSMLLLLVKIFIFRLRVETIYIL